MTKIKPGVDWKKIFENDLKSRQINQLKLKFMKDEE